MDAIIFIIFNKFRFAVKFLAACSKIKRASVVHYGMCTLIAIFFDGEKVLGYSSDILWLPSSRGV